MKFRKKPVVIEAEQFNPSEFNPIHIDKNTRQDMTMRDKFGFIGKYPCGVYHSMSSSTGFMIDTLEGKHEVSIEDWIVTGVKGEKYPVKPDIFEMTYEKIED